MIRTIEKKHIALPLSRFAWPGKIRRLARSECPVFFPADVSVQDQTVHICFRTEGYRPLKEIPELTAIQALGILKELIQKVHIAGDWMWYPDKLVLSPDTVWVSTDGRIRLLCIPDSRKMELFRRLNLFAESIKKLIPESEQSSISQLQKQWFCRSHPVHRTVGGIDRMILDLQEYSSYHFIK